MQDFYLTKERALLAHLNTRTELHGDEDVPACDLKLELNLHNSVLNKLHSELREVFYTADKQADIEADHLVNLRFPQMSAFAWDTELPRAVLTIHDDVDGDFVIQGKANKFKLELLEGGTTKLQIRFQMGEIDPQDAATLFGMLRQTVSISLAPEDEEEKPDNFEQADLLGSDPATHSDARKNAEKAFKNPIGAQSPEELVGLEPEAPPA